MMLTMMATAQVDETFQFVDAAGNVVADGTTIVVNQLNEKGEMVIPLTVRNTSGEKAAVSMYENIDAMPNGEWQTCAFGNCKKISETGYSAKDIVDGDYTTNIGTEWIPEQGSQGFVTWEATLQIHVFNTVMKSQFGVTSEVAGNEVIGYGPTVTVRFVYGNIVPSQDTKEWWGYVGKNEEYTILGTGQATTFDCAAFYPGDNVVAAGKTISAVRFAMLSKNVKNVKVWIAESRPSDVSRDALQVVEVNNLVEGINEVELAQPYTITSKGVYVGYTFTVSNITTQYDYYPVCTAGNDVKDGLWLRWSGNNWSDLYGQGFGSLYLQVLLEGQFYKNAAIIARADLGESITSLGSKSKVYVPIANYGTEPITSFDYVISVNSKAVGQGHIVPQSPIEFGATRTYGIEVDADEQAGSVVKTITLAKVNEKDNESEASVSASFTLCTVSKIVDHAIAIEEFTGTTCGYCPRGIAGLEKLNKKYGDKVVCAAIHGYAGNVAADAMLLINWQRNYANIFSGAAPSCHLNRSYGEIDPYYGTLNDICDDVDRELLIPAKVGIKLSGKWNEDSTKVVATAQLEAVTSGQSYTIEYALIADSLKGTTTAWNQANYYASSTSNDPDIARFCKGGEYGQSTIKGLAFNDAVIATCYSAGRNLTTAPGTLRLGDIVTNTYTLTMPSDSDHPQLVKAIDKSKVAVVAFVITANGTIANAAKFYMPGKNAVGDVNGDAVVDVADVSSVISVMAGENIESFAAADVNGDGNVDVADISSIISIMAGK